MEVYGVGNIAGYFCYSAGNIAEVQEFNQFNISPICKVIQVFCISKKFHFLHHLYISNGKKNYFFAGY